MKSFLANSLRDFEWDNFRQKAPVEGQMSPWSEFSLTLGMKSIFLFSCKFYDEREIDIPMIKV